MKAILLITLSFLLAGCDNSANDFRSRSGYRNMGTSSQAMTNHLQGADVAGAGFDLPGSESAAKMTNVNR